MASGSHLPCLSSTILNVDYVLLPGTWSQTHLVISTAIVLCTLCLLPEMTFLFLHILQGPAQGHLSHEPLLNIPAPSWIVKAGKG